MKTSRCRSISWLVVGLALTLAAGGRLSLAGDWPLLGRDGTRNAVSAETGSPTLWRPERRDRDRKQTTKAQGVRWTAKLGLQSFSSPVISGGLVWIGICDAQVRDGKEGYVSALQCFRVADGKSIPGRTNSLAWRSSDREMRGGRGVVENDARTEVQESDTKEEQERSQTSNH